MENIKQPESHNEWFVIVKEQELSGLSQTELCKQH